MKIGEMARISGLTERMLRHYEDLGILVPSKSDKGTRLYDQTDLEIARLMHELRALDIPLDTIAEIALERSKHKTGDSSSARVGALLSLLAETLAQKAERALRLRGAIISAAEMVRECKGCKNVPSAGTCPDCTMNEHASENPFAALIWK